MVWIGVIKTIGLCLVSLAIEAISVSKEGVKWFESLKQPAYSFPVKMWYVVGAVYYIIFGVATYRQFATGKSFFSAVMLLLTFVMIINGLSNFILFKYRSLKWFYLIIYPFIFILLILIILLWKDDKMSACLISFYFLWLFYDVYYTYNIWRLNCP